MILFCSPDVSCWEICYDKEQANYLFYSNCDKRESVGRPAVVARHGGADSHDGVPLGLEDNVGQSVQSHTHRQLLLEVPGCRPSVKHQLVHLPTTMVTLLASPNT